MLSQRRSVRRGNTGLCFYKKHKTSLCVLGALARDNKAFNSRKGAKLAKFIYCIYIKLDIPCASASVTDASSGRRQGKLERGALVQHAMHRQAAAVKLEDSRSDSQAETQACNQAGGK